MRVVQPWLGAPRRLMWSFGLLLLLPAVAVGWLGFRLIEQDRELTLRQSRERRDTAADRLVARFRRLTKGCTASILSSPCRRSQLGASKWWLVRHAARVVSPTS